MKFGQRVLSKDLIRGKRVLEIGAVNVNGSLRGVVEALEPLSYIGVDVILGEGVDYVCDCEDIVRQFGSDSFDLVIATEVVEHIENWRSAIMAIKSVCKPSGRLLVTTRSRGFPYHGYPKDCWRFELEDMRGIFEDFFVEALESDPEAPGVFVLVKKPQTYKAKDLDAIRLYSIISKKRVNNILFFEKVLFIFWYVFRWKIWAKLS